MKEYRKDILTPADIAYVLDPSVLKLDTSLGDVEEMVEACKKYGFGCCFCWPTYYPQLAGMLQGTNTVWGTSLAFPSGQEDTATKVWMAKYFSQWGPVENDMVLNIGFLKTGEYQKAIDDIVAVKEATPEISLKVIIEAMILSDDEIKRACEIVVKSGADYVKSGTGFSANPTTLHHVEIMKAVAGNDCKIKIAGGVRDLETLVSMYAMGANRFGVGLASSVKIIEQAGKYPDGIDVKIMKTEETPSAGGDMY